MKKIAFITAVLLISGCTVIPQPKMTTAVYNLTATEATEAVHQDISEKPRPTRQLEKLSKKILITNITAPLWLDNRSIHYRLNYHDAAQTYTYATSRWSSPPAFLLTHKLKQQIGAVTDHLIIKDSSMAIAEYELHIELEEFSQIFDTLTDSHVIIRFRASLVSNAHRLIAQKTFSSNQAAPTADAVGAVNAFSAASNQLIVDLTSWLNHQLIKI